MLSIFGNSISMGLDALLYQGESARNRQVVAAAERSAEQKRLARERREKKEFLSQAIDEEDAGVIGDFNVSRINALVIIIRHQEKPRQKETQPDRGRERDRQRQTETDRERQRDRDR